MEMILIHYIYSIFDTLICIIIAISKEEEDKVSVRSIGILIKVFWPY